MTTQDRLQRIKPKIRKHDKLLFYNGLLAKFSYTDLIYLFSKIQFQ